HPDVDTGELPHERGDERAAQDLATAALVRRPDEDIGRAALQGDSANSLDEIVALLLEEVGPEHDREPAQGRELYLLFRGERLSRRLHPECVERGSKALRRPPGAPEDALRAGL